ncbi:activating transcription factor 3-like [Hydractinia symbiolongicarpus]|uniref:activating transcription factor 3-like n=1 Tax=Hydractinia symbiolongicarpus TaxID=13093 RepID=UPI00254BD2B8|nr:activating transcription factor 3-like [Hydractinia symbiolongicarpus]
MKMVGDSVFEDISMKDAKSALRDALRAKLKSSSFEDNYEETSRSASPTKIIDVEALGNDSDSNDSSDERMLEDKDSNTIPIEERRLRNRLAARKCREKRKQRIVNLEKICNNLESRISQLQNEIEGLDGQKKSLTKLLENHTCVRLAPKPTAVITNNVMTK